MVLYLVKKKPNLLGNKTYEHFNAMGIFVDAKLEALGGRRVHDLGSGDDDANLEEK